MTLSTTVHNGSMTAASACVWPPTPRPWPLRSLSEAQWQFWEVNGYVAIPDAVPASLVRAAARRDPQIDSFKHAFVRILQRFYTATELKLFVTIG